MFQLFWGRLRQPDVALAQSGATRRDHLALAGRRELATRLPNGPGRFYSGAVAGTPNSRFRATTRQQRTGATPGSRPGLAGPATP